MSDVSTEQTPAPEAATTPAAIPADSTAQVEGATSEAPVGATESTGVTSPTAEQAPQLFTDRKDEAPVEQAVEHPEWFKADKYKTVEDQAMAYNELSEKMGGYWGAPKDGYTLPESVGINQNDPVLKHMGPALQELGLSNKGFEKLMGSYEQATDTIAKEMQAEVAKTLHATEAETVKTVDQWINNSFDSQDAKTMKGWIQSVGDFQLLNKLRASLPTSTNVPSTNFNNGVVFESSADVEAIKIENRDRYNNDPAFRRDVSQRSRDARLREQKK